jgi:hypothetical protein
LRAVDIAAVHNIVQLTRHLTAFEFLEFVEYEHVTVCADIHDPLHRWQVQHGADQGAYPQREIVIGIFFEDAITVDDQRLSELFALDGPSILLRRISKTLHLSLRVEIVPFLDDGLEMKGCAAGSGQAVQRCWDVRRTLYLRTRAQLSVGQDAESKEKATE